MQVKQLHHSVLCSDADHSWEPPCKRQPSLSVCIAKKRRPSSRWSQQRQCDRAQPVEARIQTLQYEVDSSRDIPKPVALLRLHAQDSFPLIGLEPWVQSRQASTQDQSHPLFGPDYPKPMPEGVRVFSFQRLVVDKNPKLLDKRPKLLANCRFKRAFRPRKPSQSRLLTSIAREDW